MWNLFTLVGALVGDAAGDPRQWGLDGAAVAAFLGLLWPRLRAGEAWAVAGACALVTVLARPGAARRAADPPRRGRRGDDRLGPRARDVEDGAAR